MNIFILHALAKRCARYHCDKHVIKMILESAQMLCTAHRVLDDTDEINGQVLYKLTHKNHPCTIWTRKTSENYKWLYTLFVCLCDEYKYRYEKTHLTDTKFRNVLINVPENIEIGELTEFALAMPDEYKVEDDPVQSYRNYYNNDKQHLFAWKSRPIPKWID
jgi:hypothetical protein